MPNVALIALEEFPLIQSGDDLASRICQYEIQNNDIIVVAQKVVSKAEGRTVRLADISPSDRAQHYAGICGKDPRLIELILRESSGILRAAPGLIIVEHRLGFILANAGIDASNSGGEGLVVLLPEDPDRTARALCASIEARIGVNVGVVITDSWGRPWRLGTVGFAIGVAGMPAIMDLRGRRDLFGRALEATEVGTADEVAAAASLLMGQADEASPVIIVRGLELPPTDGRSIDLLRSPETDQFR